MIKPQNTSLMSCGLDLSRQMRHILCARVTAVARHVESEIQPLSSVYRVQHKTTHKTNYDIQ